MTITSNIHIKEEDLHIFTHMWYGLNDCVSVFRSIVQFNYTLIIMKIYNVYVINFLIGFILLLMRFCWIYIQRYMGFRDWKGWLWKTQDAWRGKICYAKLFQKLQENPEKGIKSEQWSWSKQPQQLKESTKQHDIVKMIKDMRAQSDSDPFSGWNSSDSDFESDPRALKG